MAAVLFADLVGYSRKPVADQFAAKGSFRELLQGVLAPLDPGSRMVLDTGDGAAIAFLADPEHALYVALELRSRLESGAAGSLLHPVDLRLGMNLGPVKRMVDLNGQPNLVGEGMNSAERVMSFASPGETTASRAFCDAISCLRQSYRQLFEPLGRRADKHGREHEVFRVNATSVVLDEARSSVVAGYGSGSPGAPESAQQVLPPAAGELRRAGGKRTAWLAVAVMLVLGGTAAAWFASRPEVTSASPPALPAAASGNPPVAKPSLPAAIPADNEVAAVRSLENSPAAGPPPPAGRARDPEPAPLRPRAERAPQQERAVSGDSSRCAALTQRAALGESLGPNDQEELRKSCR